MLRTKWKSLRDTHKRYQKQQELAPTKSSNCMRYYNWRWAQNLQFLENCDQLSLKSKISSTSLQDYPLESELPPSIQLVSTTSIPAKPLLEPEIVYLESPETLSNDNVPEVRYSSFTRSTPAIESTKLPDPLHKSRTSPTKRSNSKSGDSDDGDKEHLVKRLKLEEQSQAVDLLFKSYAETFKSFTVKNQVLLKVKLAKLFADAELDEMNEPSVVFSSTSVTDELGLDLETSKHSPDSDNDISSID